MPYQLAQLNIAHFKKQAEHPDNKDFFDSLDRVNAIAESQPGFVWRLIGDGNDATDIRAFDDPNMIVNLSVWRDLDALADFVYRNPAHLQIMRRRAEWFDRIKTSFVLWWVPTGHRPSVDEARTRLQLLEDIGPSERAFTFREPYPSPKGDPVSAILDDCA